MLRTHFFCAFSFIISISGCGQDLEQNETISTSHSDEEYTFFRGPQEMGELETDLITEASGIAVSEQHNGSLWVHNDSGNDPFIFLIDQQAQLQKRFFLLGIENQDWEDMALGPGPDSGQQYIYIADIGDNFGIRDKKTIYYFPEPAFKRDDQAQSDTVSNISAIHFKYPDGNHDAEALLIDPRTQDIYIIIKDSNSPTIYKLPADDLQQNKVLTLQKCGNVEIEIDNALALITAGEIGANGLEILIKTYGKVYFWERDNLQTTICELLRSTPEILKYTPEPQGEAIAFTPDQDGYYTLSEERFGKTPLLLFYPRE